MAKFYNSYSDYLKNKYGYKIYKVGVSAGFSCPHRDSVTGKGGCVFCDELGSVAAYLRTNESMYKRNSEYEEKTLDKAVPDDLLDIKNQIKRAKTFLINRYKAEHFSLYFQSFSNTYGKIDLLKKKYDYGLSFGSWDELIISTRPDCLDDEKLMLISSYKNYLKDVCIELGLQSGSDRILKLMNRGHDVNTYMTYAEKVKNYGLSLCTHIMIGFPTESKKDLDLTIDAINNSQPDFIKIHNLNIVKDTILYQDYINGKIRAPSVDEYLNDLVYVLRRISEKIVLQRLICETPSHRLASPRNFPDKNSFIKMLDSYMEKNMYTQGDLLK